MCCNGGKLSSEVFHFLRRSSWANSAFAVARVISPFWVFFWAVEDGVGVEDAGANVSNEGVEVMRVELDAKGRSASFSEGLVVLEKDSMTGVERSRLEEVGELFKG